MKALIKGGVCVALGWLANGVGAQEIQWRASGPKNSTPIAAVTATGKSDAGVRPVSLSQPVPLDSLAPTIRAQAADEKGVPAVPKLEKIPRPLPKENGFTPPPPTFVAPSPVFGNLGMTPDGEFHGGCGPDGFGSAFRGRNGGSDRSRYWVSAEYLMWWQREQNVPPLVVSSPLNANPVLGLNTTSILYDHIPNGTRGGGRFALGMWLPHYCCNLGVETNFFFLGRQTTEAVFVNTGNTRLARPFFEVNRNIQNGELFDRTTIQTFTQVWGIEANLRYKWHCGSNYWLDVIGGYRHLNLSEGINISEAASAPGIGFLEQESFRTRNQFNGTQIGLDGECRLWNRWFIGATTKVAMGAVHQIINIDGTTTFSTDPNNPQQGALLATPTNIGRYTANRFGVLPEVSMKVGLDVTDNLRLFVGYDFLYLSSVLRPGDQIDTNVNLSFRDRDPRVVGVPASTLRVPTVPYRTSGYWAQGLNFGLQYRY